MTAVVGVVGASLALAAPAFAAPSPFVPHIVSHQRTSVRKLQANAATTAKGPTEYVSNSGSDTNPNGTANTCRLSAQPCLTIQHAINIAPIAGTIKVAAGNYPEQLTINGKALTIIGAGVSTTTIDPTSLQTDTNDPNDPNDPQAVIVDFQNASGGGLSNLTVNGTGVSEPSEDGCGLDYIGVQFANSSGALKTDMITGIQEQPGDFGCQPGADGGVYVANNDGATHTVTMSALKVNAYDKDGITCVNTGTICMISGSKVTGIGATDQTAQNGIEFYGIDQGSISNTTVTGNTYTSPMYDGQGTYFTSASGILAYEVAKLTLTKDVATKNDINVYAETDSSAPEPQKPWSITHNTITNATNDTGQTATTEKVPVGEAVGDGLDLDGPADVTVTGNTITGNADWGLALFGTTGSTIGGSTTGLPNTIANNAYDGIYVGQDTGVAVATSPSTGNTVEYNVVRKNAYDGVYADAPVGGVQQDSANTFNNNQLSANLLYDAEDLSTGGGSEGTANTWMANICTPAGDTNPSGLCSN